MGEGVGHGNETLRSLFPFSIDYGWNHGTCMPTRVMTTTTMVESEINFVRKIRAVSLFLQRRVVTENCFIPIVGTSRVP